MFLRTRAYRPMVKRSTVWRILMSCGIAKGVSYKETDQVQLLHIFESFRNAVFIYNESTLKIKTELKNGTNEIDFSR